LLFFSSVTLLSYFTPAESLFVIIGMTVCVSVPNFIQIDQRNFSLG